MIALYIIGAIIGIVLILLFLPLTIDLAYEGELLIKIRYLGITFKDNKRKKRKKKAGDENQTAEDDDDFLLRTYNQKGLVGTVRYLCSLLKILLTKLLWIVKRFKLRKFELDLTVATDDAANTAIRYGEVCAAAYPVLSLLHSVLDINPKKMNINADFDKTKTEFRCCVLARTALVFWFIAVFEALKEDYKLELKESERNERKQSKNRNGHNTGKPSHNG